LKLGSAGPLTLAVVLLGGGCALGGGGAPRLPAAAAGTPERVILVSVAGLGPGVYGGASPTMPTVAALGAAGVAAERVAPVAPAATYPAHATLVTGRVPAGHGIVADRLLGQRGVRRTPYRHASLLRARTLWQAVSERGGDVAALAWPTTVGAAIPLLLPDLVPTRRGERWLEMLRDATTPSVLALAEAAGQPEADASGPARDRVLVDVACDLLRAATPPRLLLLRLSQTAPPLAFRGPGSPEAARAFARADGEIARLLGCLHGADRLEQAAIVVVGDHAVAPVHTSLAPNAVLAQAGLIDADALGVNRWRAIARSNGGSSFVYARDDEAALRARTELTAAAARSGAFRIITAGEMLRDGADPTAWFGLEAEPGFRFSDDAQGALVRVEAWRGAGGYLPESGVVDPGFVAWGRGIQSGLRVPQMRQTDIAPTLARLFGVDLGDGAGRVLVGLLRPEEVPEVALPGEAAEGGGS
jgi:hypothetical protein